MKLPLAAASMILLGVSIVLAQVPGNPAQSPASPPRPQTATSQSYPAEQIQAGQVRFGAQCGFCHGRDAAGGETGPDLTRSLLVADDVRGDKLGPVIRQGRPDKGMPALGLGETDLMAVIAFIHDQKTKFETLGGGRRSVNPADLAVGDVSRGRRYFNGAGRCTGCHSVTGDLAGVGSRHSGLQLLQQMLYPGRSASARPGITVTLASGETISGSLASEDEFTVTVLDAAGARQNYARDAVKIKIDNPLAAHFDQLQKYTDRDMHNVYAYLETLK
jgi:cytochrome c oxidase cbb3-type subunit III